MNLDVHGFNGIPEINNAVLLPLSLMGIDADYLLCNHYTLADFAFQQIIRSLCLEFAVKVTTPKMSRESREVRFWSPLKIGNYSRM